ncbi:uncharacterized protein LOC111337017 isoform X1 [Stylophora pistillata]|uniref:uncharacterized protein LOC111337017 isoform X1 n=1 Tax=Stylophora pistillata TaxID=50429 RepID=UPI000C040586|nr:uncharacterized protein LOC111337017 isoform X1 [Stylophora pistillata]
MRDVQLESFTYVCHVSCFLNRWAMEIACSDFSVCNIAIITAIRYLEGRLSLILQREPPMDLKPAQIPRLKDDRTDKVEDLLEDLLERDMVLGLTEELKWKVNLSIESVLRRMKEFENVTVEHKVKSIVKTNFELKDELESWQRAVFREERELKQEKLEYEVKSKFKQVMDLRKKLKAELGHASKDEIVFLVRLKRALILDVAFIRECMAGLEEKLSLEVKHLEPKLRGEVELLLQRGRVPEYELIGRNPGLEIDQPEVKLKKGLKLPVDRVHELQNKIACIEELVRILETGHRRQELDQEESNFKQKLEFLLERERGSPHEMQYRDYQVLKFVLDQERRWKGELQERKENPVAFLIERNRELEHKRKDVHVNREQELGREWIAETWKAWTLLSKCEGELTSTELAWVRNRFHELEQLEVNLTAEEELESLLIKEGRLYDELTSNSEPSVRQFDRIMEGLVDDFQLSQIFSTTEGKFKSYQLPTEDLIGFFYGSKQREIEESKKKLETLKERKPELIHEMEMELNRKRDHEVKGAQCWTAWVENELMPQGRENLMMKKYRWLRLNMLTSKLKKQLEQGLERELDRVRNTSMAYSARSREYGRGIGNGVWELYLRVLEKEIMEMNPYLVAEFLHGSFKYEEYTNFLEGLHDVESIVNEDILICHSPGGKWVLEANGFQKNHILRKRNGELSCDHETPQRAIEKVTHFSFTNDDSYLVYLTDNGLLHALSLDTGTVLTSVSNNNVVYFTWQCECGYFFRSDTEEKAILFSDLFSPFKFIPASLVELAVPEKTIAAVFYSTNTVLAVSSDLKVSFWQTPEAKDGFSFSFISQFLLDRPGLEVKNCALSPNGQHIAINQGSRLMLYTFKDFSLAETDTVFIEEFGYTVSCIAFSGDSASLLLCIQAFRSFTRGDVWDVVGKFVSSSVKSQKLVAVECCRLSSDKQEVILCGQYQIEIWKYGESSCHLLTTIHVENIHHSLRFSQCIVSSDNQLLVCCIGNTILIYRRNASNVNSSKRVLHGHLCKVEFCRFLKENRYLISYGIDGKVFLWDTSGQEDRCKAVGFTKIPVDTVVCMAVSPDEEKIVCFSSINLMCLVKLCNLKSFSQ